MATLCNVFLVAIGMSFLALQVSYGHELFGVSINEDERESCPNTNCLGQASCNSDTQCSPYKCCIDLVNSRACCHPPGGPTNPPATPPTENPATAPSTANPATAPSTANPAAPSTANPAAPSTANPTTDSTDPATDSGESPLCTAYFENSCGPADDSCACTGQDDCYPGEVCCLEITTNPSDGEVGFKLACHPTVELTTTPKPEEGDVKCPTTDLPLKCAPFHGNQICFDNDTDVTPAATACGANEICCKVGRDDPPCCVVYP